MNVGRDLLDVLEMIRRNQEQVDLLVANNTRLTAHLIQTGLIQNLGGLAAFQQLLQNGAATAPHQVLQLPFPKRKGRPPNAAQSLHAMGVPFEDLAAAGIEAEIDVGAPREKRAYTKKAPKLVDGVDVGPSKQLGTRVSLTSSGNKRYKRVYENDPEGTYVHRPDGSIKIGANGKPRLNDMWTPERRAKMSERAKNNFAKLSKRQVNEMTAKRLKTRREKLARGAA
jgi:hypothetical protein